MNNYERLEDRYVKPKDLWEKAYVTLADEKRRMKESAVLSYFGNVSIKKVIYNDKATIVFWSDNTKTVTKCGGDDNYNQEYALMMCVLKKLHSTKSISRFLKVWTNNDTVGTVTVKDARKKEKENV